jgi:hypothetical protein
MVVGRTQPSSKYGGRMAVEDSEAQKYIAELNKTSGALCTQVHEMFIAAGCNSYVKTIYIGYDVDGEMVAALYGHADHVEVALALAEDHTSSQLIDASHLTWKTLPVAAIGHDLAEVAQMRPLIDEACARVRAGQHDVNRDNDFFVKAKRERRGR